MNSKQSCPFMALRLPGCYFIQGESDGEERTTVSYCNGDFSRCPLRQAVGGGEPGEVV